VDGTVKGLAYNGVAYSKEAVITGKYPVYATPRMYTKGQPTGDVKAFIDFFLSPAFQNKYVAPLGFIPVAAVPGAK
jgi:phosphate transport system substrate-binding protein